MNGIHHAPGGRTSSQKPLTSRRDDPEVASDPTQVKFLPKCGRKANSNWLTSWSRKELMLLLLCGLFFVTCVIVVSIVLARDLRTWNQHLRNRSKEVCVTKACVSTAAQLMAGMDLSADPCEDFFQFACGRWNKMHAIPEEKSHYTTFDKLQDDLHLITKNLLEEPQSAHDSNATLKAKILYKSCINMSSIEDKGDAPLRAVIADLGGWPVLDDQWSGSDFILEDVLAKVAGKYGKPVLFKLSVGVDDKNSSVYIIQVQQGVLVMPSREYYLLSDHEHHKQAYSRLMREVTRLLGGEGLEVDRQLQDILDFEVTLANLTLPSDEIQDTGATYNKMTVRELQELIPSFNVLRYLRGLVSADITEDEPVVVFATDYLRNIADLIPSVDKRTLANYLVWRIVVDFVPELNHPYLQADAQYRQATQGVLRDTVRWEKCVKLVNEKMGMAVGALFIRDNFKKESKDTALEMIHNLREAFNELLAENEWMDEQTKLFARDKANAMVERIGYPDFLTDPVQLDAKHDTLHFQEDTYFDNLLALQDFSTDRSMEKLRQSVRQEEYEYDPVVINAFYHPNTNSILFPAGILQPLFYSASFPKSLNYGGIGMVIGHEITHGFDDRGRQYDKFGNIQQWWDDQTIQDFRVRAQCFIDQYSQYKLEQIDEFMNGKITLGENIADNGGLKQAYRAYRKWVMKNGEEPELPGIELSHSQLFFLNYAQIWCGNMRNEDAWRKIRTSVHSQGPLRVLGPLSNSKEFSRAYNCSLGSRMNPVQKCSVW